MYPRNKRVIRNRESSPHIIHNTVPLSILKASGTSSVLLFHQNLFAFALFIHLQLFVYFKSLYSPYRYSPGYVAGQSPHRLGAYRGEVPREDDMENSFRRFRASLLFHIFFAQQRAILAKRYSLLCNPFPLLSLGKIR